MWRRHVCYVCKRSVCGGDEPQPVAHLSHKLQCARQSLKIMVSYGNKYPRHNARPHVVEQSGQCARALYYSRWNSDNYFKKNRHKSTCSHLPSLKDVRFPRYFQELWYWAVTKAYFWSECVGFSWLRIRLIFYTILYLYKLSMKYQSYPKSRKTDAFGLIICLIHE